MGRHWVSSGPGLLTSGAFLPQAHTMYQVGLMETDQHIEFFWGALEMFAQEELCKFIKFACNQERIPFTCPCKDGGPDTAHVPPYPMKIAPPDGTAGTALLSHVPGGDTQALLSVWSWALCEGRENDSRDPKAQVHMRERPGVMCLPNLNFTRCSAGPMMYLLTFFLFVSFFCFLLLVCG